MYSNVLDSESMPLPPKGLACKSLTVPVHVHRFNNVNQLHVNQALSPHKRMYAHPNDIEGLGLDDQIAPPQPGSSLTSDALPGQSSDNLAIGFDVKNPQLYSLPSTTQAISKTEETRVVTREECIASHAKRIQSLWPEPTQSARKLFPDFCDVYSKIKDTLKPNCFGAKIPLQSDLVIPAWRKELADYHDEMLCDFLEFGWPLGYHSDVAPQTTDKNHPSGEAFRPHISQFIEKELNHKAVLGPFHHDPFEPWVRYSPIMTRPKKDSDQRRVILDLSYPKGRAVNDGIAVENHFGQDISYTLPTIEDFAQRLISQGPSAFMWKADLSRAYRQLRADPLDAPLLGLRVGRDIYIDLCPPFGCRSSAAICQRMANALVYIMNGKGFHLMAYLDDFGACFASEVQAHDSFAAFQELTASLGLSLAEGKSVTPTHQLDWLGYSVDSKSMTITIPQKKLDEVLKDCNAWLNKTRANKRTIQAIVGRLVYISNAVLPGRKFIARILGTLRAMGEDAWVTLNKGFKADLQWFAAYAKQANGRCLVNPVRPVFNIECDASLHGAGGNSPTHCYQWVFSPAYAKAFTAIHHLEAINIVVAIRTLQPRHSEEPFDICDWTDNSASAWALQTGRTKDPILAACSREIWLIAALHSYNITIKHKPGTDLPLADALSRAAHDTAKARLAAEMISNLALITVDPVLNNYTFFSSFL